MARTSQESLDAQAVQSFRSAASSLDHRAVAAPEDAEWDVTVTVDGLEVHAALKAGAVITPEVVTRFIASVDNRRTTISHVAVGDLVTSAAQDALRDAG